MASLYPSQIHWNTKDALRRARLRATKYFAQKRQLLITVRDLKRSRDLWKQKYEELAASVATEVVSPHEFSHSPLQLNHSKLVPKIDCSHFKAFIVFLAISLYIGCIFRFRAVAKAVRITFDCLCPLVRSPCYSTIRWWIYRVGLYRLQNARVGPRWAMICDHTATFAGVKLLLICGVDLDVLTQRMASKTGSFSVSCADLQTLAMIPMSHSSGAKLLECYQACIQKHGAPVDMISDRGSDLVKSAKLLIEHQKNSQSQVVTRHFSDISHVIARLIQATFTKSKAWEAFEVFIKRGIELSTYKMKHLRPPCLRHGPDRWMNLGGVVQWFSNMVERVEQSQQGTPPPAKPRYGLTKLLLERAKEKFSSLGKYLNRLKNLCGKIYPDAQSYHAERERCCPESPEEINAYFEANEHLNSFYLNEIMAEWKQHVPIHREMKKLLEFSHALQKTIKINGFSQCTLQECQILWQEARLEGAGEQVGKKIMEWLENTALRLSPGETILMTSDAIESLNGKWKMCIEGSATPALGANGLLIPGLTGGEIGIEEVQKALNTVSIDDVEKWKRETFGLTFFDEKHRQREAKPLH